MPDETPQPESISNYIITTATGTGNMSAYLMTKCTQRNAENTIRLIQWGRPANRVCLWAIAGTPSASIKGAIELKCLEHFRPTDYIQTAAFLIEEHWIGREGKQMSHDIDLIIERLRDCKARRTSRPAPLPPETPLDRGEEG